MAKAVVNADGCVGCEACLGSCPVEAIAMAGDKAVINADACIECGVCVPACPVACITQ